MMKRRFTTITTILAGNTAFFATQAIATQEMQPTAQVADQYMIIDLENIPTCPGSKQRGCPDS